jgi:hypothetical protein
VRYNLPTFQTLSIRFPLLKATSNGKEVANQFRTAGNSKDIIFYFEALHYLSTNSLVYQYRLKGLDTVGEVAIFSNQLSFSRCPCWQYTFEIKAIAGPNYKSK